MKIKDFKKMLDKYSDDCNITITNNHEEFYNKSHDKKYNGSLIRYKDDIIVVNGGHDIIVFLNEEKVI
jgi:hypothetical protein